MKPGLPAVSWRPAQEGDAAFLRELHDLNRPDLLPLPPEVRGPLLNLQYRARSGGHAAQYPAAHHLILESGGERVGQMLISGDDAALVLVDFAVHPARQGQGLGGVALALLQTHAGTRPVHLHVALGSPAARLYTRAGFQAQGTDGLHTPMTWTPAPSRPHEASTDA